jgi:hypothetical protein
MMMHRQCRARNGTASPKRGLDNAIHRRGFRQNRRKITRSRRNAPKLRALKQDETRQRRDAMRKLILAAAAVSIVMSVPLSTIVKAEDTTIIKKDYPDGDSSKTVIKNEEPYGEKKVIIKKDYD